MDYFGLLRLHLSTLLLRIVKITVQRHDFDFLLFHSHWHCFVFLTWKMAGWGKILCTFFMLQNIFDPETRFGILSLRLFGFAWSYRTFVWLELSVVFSPLMSNMKIWACLKKCFVWFCLIQNSATNFLIHYNTFPLP